MILFIVALMFMAFAFMFADGREVVVTFGSGCAMIIVALICTAYAESTNRK